MSEELSNEELVAELRRSLSGERPPAFASPAEVAPETEVAEPRGKKVSAAAMAIADQILGLDTGGTRAVPFTPIGLRTKDGSVVELGEERVVGRQLGEGRIVVSDGRVSRAHVRVYREAAAVYAADLGSSNGTLLVRGDDTLPVGVEPVELHVGDRLATVDGLELAEVVELSS